MGILFLQESAYAGDGTAGACAGNENIHSPLGVFPNFRAGGSFVSGGVGGIVKLTGQETAGVLRRKGLCQGDGAGHAFPGRGEDHLRTVGPHQLLPFPAHVFRHYDGATIPPGSGHGAQADAGISRGGLDDHAAGLDQPPVFRIVQHGLCHPILGRTGGIIEFQLGKKRCFPAQAGQGQQGRVADELGKRCVVHGGHSRIISYEHYTPLWNRMSMASIDILTQL